MENRTIAKAHIFTDSWLGVYLHSRDPKTLTDAEFDSGEFYELPGYEVASKQNFLKRLESAPKYKYVDPSGSDRIKLGTIKPMLRSGQNLRTMINGEQWTFNNDCLGQKQWVLVNAELDALEKALKDAAFERSELTFTNLEKAAKALLEAK